jgi:hypothetical protein
VTSTVGAAANSFSGKLTLELENAAGFNWIASGALMRQDGAGQLSAGKKATSAELDRFRITTVGGTDTFDVGAVNYTCER